MQVLQEEKLTIALKPCRCPGEEQTGHPSLMDLHQYDYTDENQQNAVSSIFASKGNTADLVQTFVMMQLINPRHACAARVTVVVLCVCLFVCQRLFSHYRLRGGL